MKEYSKNDSKEQPKEQPVFEFHIDNEIRKTYQIESVLFSTTGNVILADFKKARELAFKISAQKLPGVPKRQIKAGELIAMGLIDEILHHMVFLYRSEAQADVFTSALDRFAATLGGGDTEALLGYFCGAFPPQAVYAGSETVPGYLAGEEAGYSRRAMALEEILLLQLANLNPAFKPFRFFFDDKHLKKDTVYPQAMEELKAHLALLPAFGPDGQNLWDLLRAPALACPDSLAGQLRWIRERWGALLGKFMARLITALDVIAEEEKPQWHGAPGPTEVYDYGYIANEYERFSSDREWMPRCVLMAKCALVWLYQLSGRYGRDISRLDQIPDEELDELARRGFTGLWLIGLWERSAASRTIKQWKGNSEAAASAYSLYDYDIAGELGGWGALTNLRERCACRGIRLGSDMVPNHTGIDSKWIMEHPDRFLQLDYQPFPGYQYNSGNLSNNGEVVVQIEDHYYDNTDCAVVFHYYDKRTGRRRYIYHGNDGTSMPWNDTAQIDFLNPEAREAVIQTIIGVCRQFPIVRFDAAMTLAKKHIQRLWYPEPGRGGDIASRSEHAITTEEFNRRIPNEFWREVVDRCAHEAPDTLLLAEAFWMMEGYFVRTLGMHRVYNSAFMNMLKKEENQKYRDTIKNTLRFDSEILKRFVNFMNNPDEETAVAQFGKGDKYIGVCTLMVTMPGLPMFGHGQIEGYEEKYGMEYRRAYRDETPDKDLVERHEREIFPLMKRRAIFSGSSDFFLFDFWLPGGGVNENVFAYSNRNGNDRALVFYNNAYQNTAGWIKESPIPIPQKAGGVRQDSMAQALQLHGEERYFTLLREHRQNIWFIRSSKELHENGLFVMLAGYEAQIYIDIYEVEDPTFTTWARLNAEKNGAPFINPDDELNDMLFGAMYDSFIKIFKLYYEPASYTEEVDRFFMWALNFIYGYEGAPPYILADDIPKPYISIIDIIRADIQKYSKKPAGGKKSAARGTAKSGGAPPSPAEVRAVFDDIYKKFDYSLCEDEEIEDDESGLPDSVYMGVFALSFSMLYALEQIASAVTEGGAEGKLLTEHYQIDRKLREIFTKISIDDNRAWRTVEIMKALLRRLVRGSNAAAAQPAGKGAAAAPQAAGTPAAAGTSAAAGTAGKGAPRKGKSAKSGSPGARAAELITSFRDDPDFRAILGVNVWEGEAYFNKEAFEAAVSIAPFLLSPFAPPETLRGVKQALSSAQTASGYKLDVLVEMLSK